jgi:predicted ATP-dependent endonuclease of OLD family
MKIRNLTLKNFGPFRNYELAFPDDESVCVLLTGKNNEGKSSIINALKLLDSSTRVINQKKQRIILDGEEYYKLLQQDTESLNIKRMVHNYEENIAEIRGTFDDGLEVTVYLDPVNELIYADYVGRVPYDIKEIFGFIPPLGPLSESEDIISRARYLRASLNTSLAPRHLRNHFHQLIEPEEFELIREIINTSWQDIELLNYEVNYRENRIDCYYKEKRFTREISWAGQGLQVWFQIITHLVRLRNTSVLILDEPEINLHPEKQNDLIRILRGYYTGSIIIATHSIELMNNVHISHIIHVKKNQVKPKIKSSSDRAYLELVRSQVGSNFNFIASQFEDVEVIIFTEDVSDFKIISELAKAYDIKRKAFNIPIYGFSEYRKTLFYKDAYELLIGKQISYSLLLDRDYYPDEHLDEVKAELAGSGIKVIFTPGKEIENVFLYPSLLFGLLPAEDHDLLREELETLYRDLYIDCHSNFVSLHQQCLPSHLNVKTVIKEYTPIFNQLWNDENTRHKIVAGKFALKMLRTFVKKQFGQNLSDQYLLRKLVEVNIEEIRELTERIYQVS